MFGDNDGTLELVKNATSTSRTRHIDVRHHFLRYFVGREEIRATLVKSEDHAVVLTKNLSVAAFHKHVRFLMNW
ncbi:unnamed protein product [Discosporangium mesarthrocarpum]